MRKSPRIMGPGLSVVIVYPFVYCCISFDNFESALKRCFAVKRTAKTIDIKPVRAMVFSEASVIELFRADSVLHDFLEGMGKLEVLKFNFFV